MSYKCQRKNPRLFHNKMRTIILTATKEHTSNKQIQDLTRVGNVQSKMDSVH